MKYEFNFTWKDVLCDAGLDVQEEKITASLFQKANNKKQNPFYNSK